MQLGNLLQAGELTHRQCTVYVLCMQKMPSASPDSSQCHCKRPFSVQVSWRAAPERGDRTELDRLLVCLCIDQFYVFDAHIALRPPPHKTLMRTKERIRFILGALTRTVNFIALIFTGGPSITLPVQGDALDWPAAASKLPWYTAQLCAKKIKIKVICERDQTRSQQTHLETSKDYSTTQAVNAAK